MTTNKTIIIEGSANIAIIRLIAIRRGVEFEANMKAKGSPMLFTRVGGGAIRTAKRELGLPNNTKPDVILALLDRAIAEAQGR
jgi:hypothetical protein